MSSPDQTVAVHVKSSLDGTPLVARLSSWSTMPHSQKKKDFISLMRSGSSDQVDPRLSQLEAFYDNGRISTRDFCLLVKIAASVSASVRILRTRVEPPILRAAVDVIRVHWHKSTESLDLVLTESRGAAGLVEIISSLPTGVAEKLLGAICGRGRGQTDASIRTQTVDAIVHAAIPFLNSETDSPAPIRRLAFAVLRTIIPAASTSLLQTLLPQIEEKATSRTWRTLATRNPELISQLIFIQISQEGEPDENWADSGVLGSPEHLLPAVIVLSHRACVTPGESGSDFLWKCLKCYTSHVQERGDTAFGDIFGRSPGILRKLADNGLIAKLLRTRGKGSGGVGTVLELLDMLKIIYTVEGKEGWEWDDVAPVLDFAIERLSHKKEEWISVLRAGPPTPPVDGSTAITVFHVVFKNFQAAALSLSQPHRSLISALQRLPPDARAPFLATAYFARFSVDITSESVVPPPFAASLLYLLSPIHGRGILRRGIDGHGDAFLSQPWFSWSPTLQNFQNTFSLASSSQIGNEHIRDAQLAVLRAAWGGSEIGRLGDPHGPHSIESLESVNRDLISFKSLASRARTGPERLAFLKLAIAPLILVQAVDTLDETLAWATKRFAKDPDAGIGLWNYLLREDVAFLRLLSEPLVKRTRPFDEATSYLANLKSYFDSAGRLLRTCRVLLEILIEEPGLTKQSESMWNAYGRFVGNVISGRVGLVSKLPEPLIEHADLRAAVFDDLSHLILSHGMSRTSPHSVPMVIQSSSLQVPRRVVGIIIPWIDDLGAERDVLYRNAEASGDLQVTSVVPVREKSFWPLSVTFTAGSPPEGRFDFDLTTTRFYKHIESWLFSPHSVLLSKAGKTFDPHRFHRYVDHYLDLSWDPSQVTRKVERLLAHYGADNRPQSPDTEASAAWEDHSLLLLNMWRVMDEVKRTPHLFTPRIDKLLPPYSSQSKPLQRILFDPFQGVPKVPIVDKDTILGSIVSLTSGLSPSDVGTRLFEGIGASDNIAYPVRTMERLAVLAVAWISTALDIPHSTHLERQGPISYALQHVRLDNLKALRDDSFPVYLLQPSLSHISASELKLLVKAITSLPMTPRSRTISVDLIGILRRCHTPEVVLDLSLYILADADSSSWHRHTLTKTLLKGLRPKGARSVMNRFLQFLVVRRREQLQLEARAVKPDETSVELSAVGSQESNVLLKISTIKMFLQLLLDGIEGGVFLDEAFHLAQQVMDISTHPSVLQVVITVIVELIRVEDILNASAPASASEEHGVWATLHAFVEKGSRLAENISVTNEKWDTIRRGDVPMPLLDTSHPIATTLLGMGLAQIPYGARQRWTEEVLVPLLFGQVANRTTWLKVALSREGGSEADIDLIQGTYDDTFNVATSFRQVLDQSAHAPTTKTRDTLLTLIEQRLHTRLSRRPYETLSTLTRKNYAGKEEKAKSYLTNMRLLAAHALSDDSNAFNEALSTILNGIKSHTIQPNDLAELVAVVKRLGEFLLLPDSMLVGHNPRAQTTPFSPFLSMLHNLSPPRHSPDSVKWYERIRPILEYFLNSAVGLERVQGEKFRHGGACYWPVIISLKAMLLPHPFVDAFSSAPDKANKYGAALSGLAGEVLAYPGYHLLLSTYFLAPATSYLLCDVGDVLPICRALTSPQPVDNNTGELRIVRFQIAIELNRAFPSETPPSEWQRSRNELVKAWQEDEDGEVRWMALQCVTAG